MIHRRPAPRIQILPLLWLIWWIVSHGLLLASLLYAEWDATHQVRDLRVILDQAGWYIGVISSLTLGSLHFVLWKSGLWRRGAVKLAATLLAALLGVGLIYLTDVTRNYHYRNAGLFSLYHLNEYEKLANSRQFDEMVHLMEEDCAFFNKAKKKMGGKIGVTSCNHGFSYLFGEMNPAWSSVIRLAPYTVLATLEDARHDSDRGNIGGYGEWRPLAERVRESETPILKALSAYMLEDMDGFAGAAYRLADEDPDALGLAAFASLKDPLPSRAIDRMLRYKSMKAYDTFPYYVSAEVEDHGDVKGAVLSRLKSSTIQGLDNGTLDEPLKARLRELPWANELPENYRRLLGVEE